MSAIKLAIVVAVGRNGVIGLQGNLPWRIASDLKRFKQITLGKPLIMGRKTWESLPRKPLPGRTNIVVSRSMGSHEGAVWTRSPQEALDHAKTEAFKAQIGEICLIGGAQLYDIMMDQVDRIYLTEVDLSPKGDAYFPALKPDEWRLESAEHIDKTEGDDAGFTLKVFNRTEV